MKRATTREAGITWSSGNVFRDLGLRNADELLAKAKLSIVLRRLIKRRGLTQRASAAILGVAPSDVSDLVRGELDRFSYERLIRFLIRLDVDVSIRVSQRAPGRRRAALIVEVSALQESAAN